MLRFFKGSSTLVGRAVGPRPESVWARELYCRLLAGATSLALAASGERARKFQNTPSRLALVALGRSSSRLVTHAHTARDSRLLIIVAACKVCRAPIWRRQVCDLRRPIHQPNMALSKTTAKRQQTRQSAPVRCSEAQLDRVYEQRMGRKQHCVSID
jgi:hypothetical protein